MYYTVTEIANKMGMSKAWTYKWVKENGFEKKKRGQETLIKTSDVDEASEPKRNVWVECAFAREKGCSALSIKCTDPAACAFRKTTREQEVSVHKASKRLRSMRSDYQHFIAEKYYNGKRVWNK